MALDNAWEVEDKETAKEARTSEGPAQPRRVMIYSSSEQSQVSVLRGASLVANTVKLTLGPTGHQVMLSKAPGELEMTRIGSRITKQITLSDPLESLGAQMIKEAADRTADVVGDGTTAASVLAQTIFKEGLKAVAAGESPIALKRSVDAAIVEVTDALRLASRPLNGDMISNLATIASSGDEELGTLIAEAVSGLGEFGVLTVETSRSTASDLHKEAGMQFDRGYLSPYFVTDTEGDRCILENPYVLIFGSSIANMKDLLPILEQVANAGRSLLIIAAAVEGEALSTLVVNKLRGTLKCCAVASPEFGDRRTEILEDIAVITGTIVIDPLSNMDLQQAKLENMGQAQRVTADKRRTTIVSGIKTSAAIAKRLDELRSKLETVEPREQNYLKTRMARIADGISVLRVGAFTELELVERKARAEIAVRATASAMKSGIVAGGGTAILKASQRLRLDQKDGSSDQRVGARIVMQACEKIAQQIADNAGFDGAVVVHYIKQTPNMQFGFNVQTGSFENLVRAGIIDSTEVILTSLQSAGSVATGLLTAGGFVYEPKPKLRVSDGVSLRSPYGLTQPIFPAKEWEDINDQHWKQLEESSPVEGDQLLFEPDKASKEDRLYGVAHVVGLSESDTIRTNQDYSLEVGLVRDEDVNSSNRPAEEIIFVAVVQATDELQLASWHMEGIITREQEMSFVQTSFKAIRPGRASLTVQFYHRRQWIARLALPIAILEPVHSTYV